tara:strand:+ start:10214 stop:11719 length:1506 start_codon:yes stop_codon:yes gene_type:complete
MMQTHIGIIASQTSESGGGGSFPAPPDEVNAMWYWPLEELNATVTPDFQDPAYDGFFEGSLLPSTNLSEFSFVANLESGVSDDVARVDPVPAAFRASSQGTIYAALDANKVNIFGRVSLGSSLFKGFSFPDVLSDDIILTLYRSDETTYYVNIQSVKNGPNPDSRSEFFSSFRLPDQSNTYIVLAMSYDGSSYSVFVSGHGELPLTRHDFEGLLPIEHWFNTVLDGASYDRVRVAADSEIVCVGYNGSVIDSSDLEAWHVSSLAPNALPVPPPPKTVVDIPMPSSSYAWQFENSLIDSQALKTFYRTFGGNPYFGVNQFGGHFKYDLSIENGYTCDAVFFPASEIASTLTLVLGQSKDLTVEYLSSSTDPNPQSLRFVVDENLGEFSARVLRDGDLTQESRLDFSGFSSADNRIFVCAFVFDGAEWWFFDSVNNSLTQMTGATPVTQDFSDISTATSELKLSDDLNTTSTAPVIALEIANVSKTLQELQDYTEAVRAYTGP